MADKSQSEAAKEDTWEHCKGEVQSLYVDQGLKLPLVMQLMASKLPNQSESAWKKQLTRWHFDVKNHKFPTMVAAALHYQHCKDTGQAFHFAPRDCKPVTKQEFERYLKRKRLILLEGKLIPKSSLVPMLGVTPTLGPIEVTTATQSTLTEEEEDTKDQCDLPIQGNQNALKIVSGTVPVDGRHRRTQRGRRRMILALRVRERFVRPADLIAPDIYYNHEKFLLLVKVCLSSSWEAGLWRFNDGRDFRCHVFYGNPSAINFLHLLWEAEELRLRSDMHRARKCLHRGLSMTRSALLLSVSFTVKVLICFVLKLLWKQRSTCARVILEYCLITARTLNGASPELRALFATFSAVQSEALGHITSQALEVSAKFSRAPDDVWNFRRTRARTNRISYDITLDSSSRMRALTEILNEVKTGTCITIREQRYCLKAIGWAHLEASQLEEAQQKAYDGLQWLVTSDWEGDELNRRAAPFYHLLAEAQWELGNTAGSIQAMEKSIKLTRASDCSHNLPRIRVLSDRLEILQDKQAAKALRREYEELIDGLTDWDLGDRDSSGGDDFSMAVDDQWLAQHFGTDESHLGRNENNPLQTPGIEQDSAANTRMDDPERREVRPGWQENVMQTERESLTLPLPDLSDEERPFLQK